MTQNSLSYKVLFVRTETAGDMDILALIEKAPQQLI